MAMSQAGRVNHLQRRSGVEERLSQAPVGKQAFLQSLLGVSCPKALDRPAHGLFLRDERNVTQCGSLEYAAFHGRMVESSDQTRGLEELLGAPRHHVLRREDAQPDPATERCVYGGV